VTGPSPLTLAELQRRTEAILAPVAHPRILAALALTEEVGEVTKILLEHEGYGRPLDKKKLGGELADALLALAELATRYGVDLEAASREKLEDVARRAPGWASEFGEALAKARERLDPRASS
jgi:NTP pyrophosphatase (non-canonical NTP hydrolase)